ncbi:MAG TPA: RluA family pseudouridine synthase [Thermotogota bacterium]|nr:RluA family pseudouridine synthase [Thermotogota bacterium]HPR96225.1 RluA family pseudouridine synthase [Thermotogota bacterium]
MRKEITVTEENYFNRLDKFLRKYFGEVKMASLYKMLRKGDVKVNGKRVKNPDHPIEVDDVVSVWMPGDEEKKQQIERSVEGERELKPVEMDLDILFEDEYLLALNKEAGISVHPGTGEENRATLIEGLLFYGEKNGFEPFLVHRLDKNTSGVLIIAKKRMLARRLSQLISQREVHKEYITLFVGRETDEFDADTPIDEKAAFTRFYPESTFTTNIKGDFYEFTLARAVIETGRKHQIRRHLAYRNEPVAGDTKYGDRMLNRQLGKMGLKRQFLHCLKMSFYDDELNRQYDFVAEMKDDLINFLHRIQEA